MEKKNKIKHHFKKVDLIIYQVINDVEFDLLSPPTSSRGYFARLCREIITQQLGMKAADAINKRFLDLFPNKKVTPDRILKLSEQTLRNVGMSWGKARFICDLALKTKNREVDFKNLHLMENEAVIAELTKVKGIGRWTAEMFLMFTLGREDVFSYGDLGLKRALKLLYGFVDYPSEKQADRIVLKWSPYRTYGCVALWESLDTVL